VGNTDYASVCEAGVRIAVRGVIFLLFCILPAGAVFAQSPQIRAAPLLDAGISESPYPVRVQISYQGEPVKGYLEWQTSPRVQHRIPLNLSTRTQKELMLLWGTSSPQFMLQSLGAELEWMPERGPAVRVRVPSPTELCAPVVVIGDVLGGLEVLRQPGFKLQQVTGKQSLEYPLQPVYLKPERVPVHPRWLSGVPAVVLSEGAERLRMEQWQVLIGWLLEGGILIVPAANVGTPLRQTPLAGLLPEHSGVIRRANLAESEVEMLASARRGPGEPVGMVPLRFSSENRPLAIVGLEPLVLSRTVGRGRLLVFAGDLFAPAWRGWGGYSELWWSLLAELSLPDLRTHIFEPPDPQLPERELPSLLWLGTLFAIYLTAIVVSWRVMRWKRMLMSAPLVVTLLVILAAALVAFSVPAPEGNRAYRQQRILVGTNGFPLMIEYSNGTYQTPAGAWRLEWDGSTTVGFMPNSFGRLNGAVTVWNSVPLVTEGYASSWCRVHLRTRRVLSLGRGVEVNGIWRQNAPRLTSLVNRTGLTLRNVHLFSLNGWWKVGTEVREGERLDKPGVLPFYASNESVPDNLQGFWLFAEVESMPSALQTPVPATERRIRIYLYVGAEVSP
jgi:hypothetical protein